MKGFVRNMPNAQATQIDVLELCKGGGFWEPVVVTTQEEKDYLLGMQLMLGKTFEVCLDGIDKPVRDTPPTFLRIPALQ